MLSKEFHASRRKRYAELMEDQSMGFVFAEQEKQEKGDQFYPFTPYSNFYYLTGFTQPKAILKIVKQHGIVRETLYIDHPDETMKRWLGVFYTKEEIQEQTGIQQVEYLERFRSEVPIFHGPERIQHLYIDLANWDGESSMTEAQKFAAEIHNKYPYLPIHNTFDDLGRIRRVKTEEEIAQHRRACSITEAGVKNILAHLKPDMYEYEAEAYFDFTLKSNHARHAFPTIAGSSYNACSMHYDTNDRLMKDGDMILFDLGAEWGYYASDVSRTYPVNGKFTEQQKTLYNIVLKGLQAAIDATRPGQVKDELEQISKRVMAEELMKIGMIQKPEDISKYYFHSSGHYIGLYTHDVGDERGVVLEKDMMFTLEPGLYFDELNLGIRIEDTLVVTEDGCEVFTEGIPKTVEDIEAFMKQHQSI